MKPYTFMNIKLIIIAALSFIFNATYAEDGHALWLRMQANTKDAVVKANGIKKNAIVNTAINELKHYWHGGIVTLSKDGKAIEKDGYKLEKISNAKGNNTDSNWKITAKTDCGLLYGTYALLRRQSTDCCNANDKIESTPRYDIRILNHWDDPDGLITRGYAGRSIFWKTDGKADLNTVREYARANASIGINAAAINNPNAKAIMLSKEKLLEAKRIADVMRPYGMKVYLCVNFAAPKTLGGLPTADPLDKDVITWWKNKVKEIYSLIPDFGGFVVKANSEGEPGPKDYNRSHLDGANMFADALKPYGGIVMWRAFVYSDTGEDRASQAYNEFMPFDGKFRDNVIIQIKNGPVDYQPREPVSTLFWGFRKTRPMPELQVTQEYTGESIQTCFLAAMWQEFFESLKANLSPDSPYLEANSPTPSAIAGFSNIGDSRNWCGSDMSQANWYAFGRMAWDDNLSAQQIAKEWLEQTYTTDRNFVEPMTEVLLNSREAIVHYMMPLGLHHIFAADHHYGPEPWCNPEGWREDWKPVYYHKADSVGLGFDRTSSGSKNVLQYPQPLRDIYNNVETCPEQLLLWFHHVPWNHRMHNGETLWEALCHTYDLGVREAETFRRVWQNMAPYIDRERYEAQQVNFDRQAKDAWWWRDACMLYFQKFSKMQLPIDCPKPRHNLKDLMNYHLDMDNCTRADITKLP